LKLRTEALRITTLEQDTMVVSYQKMIISALLLGATSTMLAGCGRKGDLDKPSVAVVDQNKMGTPATATPEKKFLLDPLL
jgi:predicted small lipoprotein YifL